MDRELSYEHHPENNCENKVHIHRLQVEINSDLL